MVLEGQKPTFRDREIVEFQGLEMFLLAQGEFLEQLLDVSYVLNHRNPGARVMFLVSPVDFVGQLLEVFTALDGNWRSRS